MWKHSLVIVGPGRVGTSLALDLSTSRMFGEIVVVGRANDPPSSLNAFASRSSSPSRPPVSYDTQIQPKATCVVFCVTDDRLSEVVADWAAGLPAVGESAGDEVPQRVALHVSGVHDHGSLADLAKLGWSCGSWHPLVALAEGAAGQLRGATFGIEGDPGAVDVAETLTLQLGAKVLRLEPGKKANYHAAAVFASNYLVACLHAAEEELRTASGGAGSSGALLALARSALDGVERHGLVEGATGPLTRADLGTVRAHLEALDPTRAELYRSLALELLSAVESRLDPSDARHLRELLGD